MVSLTVINPNAIRWISTVRQFAANGAKAADVVVDEIRKDGGKAVPNYSSVDQGPEIVELCLKGIFPAVFRFLKLIRSLWSHRYRHQ
jgi:hypothetical protein